MKLDVELLVPDGVVLRTRAQGVRAADASGQFGIRTGHEAFLTLLIPCVLTIQREDGTECYAAADGGVFLVRENQVSIVTREAIVADRLEDVAAVAAEMLATRHRQEQTARAEFAELQTALLRELRRVEHNP